MGGGAAVTVGPALAAVLLVLIVLAAAAALAGQLGVSRRIVVAAIRAVIQLAAVSAVIVLVLQHWWLTIAFVLLMYVIAVWTSARRVTPDRNGWKTAAPIAAGVGPVLAIVLLSTVVPLAGISVVPIAGILIGGAMTATSLAGRRALDELAQRHGEYEAALALGMSDRDAALEVCRPSAAQALVPALDQTRTVGLVTLPGAFVGVLLGGASPLQAGAAQVLVLVGLLAVEAIAVVVTLELAARGRLSRR
jgi:putative ABC transport system permease protein